MTRGKEKRKKEGFALSPVDPSIRKRGGRRGGKGKIFSSTQKKKEGESFLLLPEKEEKGEGDGPVLTLLCLFDPRKGIAKSPRNW